jgi:hypothetical protein
MDKKTIFKTDRFDVVEKEGKVGIVPHNLVVAVLPFTRDRRGLPMQLGVLKEYNRVWSKDSVVAITGIAQGEDPDILSSAMRRMRKVSGLDVQEPERWFFLGFMFTHKSVDQEMPCFACDITGMDIPAVDDEEWDDEESDGSRKPEFVLMNVAQAVDVTDCMIPAIFMKVFKYVFKLDGGLDSHTAQTDPEYDEIMDIENVSGAGKSDGVWTVHVKKGSDITSIKSKIKSIVGDSKVKIEELADDNNKKEQE